MLRSCCRPLERCFGRRSGDGLLWHMDLKPHASGDFSIAVVQANYSLEDQSQVFTSPSATYVGVYDGHGGPEASRFVNRHLFPYLHKFATEQGGLSVDVIKMAFNATEEEFLHLVKRLLPVRPQIASVGSCCLLGAISNGMLYVANLGDSRAVLGRRVSERPKSKVVAERLSNDHNVACEEVRKEVEALHPDDSAVVVYCRGVWRIKGIIQVSRSIGDVYLKKPEFNRDPLFQQFGNPVPLKRSVLSAEPSVLIRKLRPEDLFLIFASDGLWEHLSDEAAVEIVLKNPRSGIAKRLVGAALQEAAKKREMRYNDIKKIERGIRRHFHDDITVIVLYLDHQQSSTSGRFKHCAVGYTTAPVDIFSNADEAREELRSGEIVKSTGRMGDNRVPGRHRFASGKLKLNTDGSSRGDPGATGFGGLLRDERGIWIWGYMGKLPDTSSLEAEFWAIYRGLTIIFQKGIQEVEIESDSLIAVSAIQQGSSQDLTHRALIEDSRFLLQRTRSTIKHINKEGNICADKLAQIGNDQEKSLVVMEDPPSQVRQMLIADIVGISLENL